MIRLTRRTFLAGTTAMTAAGLVPFRAGAQTPRTYHALLVACTDYPNAACQIFAHRAQQRRPARAAVSARERADKFAPENVTLLADNHARGRRCRRPMRASRPRWPDIAAKVQRDDFVYLHLSGHGSQQPQAKAGNETDGFDEFFLPRDIGKWATRDKAVPNALIDDDIGAALDAIRDKGAFVWAIFDCCHSGTATRAVDGRRGRPQGRVRRSGATTPQRPGPQPPRLMPRRKPRPPPPPRGIDESSPRKPAFALTPTSAEATVKGEPRRLLCGADRRDDAGDAAAQGQPKTRRDMACSPTRSSRSSRESRASPTASSARRCCSSISADGRTRPTPLFEGELDARGVRNRGNRLIQQWPIKVEGQHGDHRGRPAASADGKGTKLAVLPIGAGGGSVRRRSAISRSQSAKNLMSRVVPVEFDGKPALKLADIPTKRLCAASRS